MAGPRQVRKNRSSRTKVKTGTTGRTKAGKKKVNFLGNETIRKNWDRKLTLAQNYDNLGLSVKLKGRAGGIEKKIGQSSDPLAITSGAKGGKLVPGEIKVIRDAEGNILEVIDAEDQQRKHNPLNDPLNDLEDSDMELEETEPGKQQMSQNPITAQLQAQAAAEAEALAKYKKPRNQSSREEEWIEGLIEKHGDNYGAMFRDKKLNPMQQSEGDIKKRVKKWKAKHSG